MKFPTIDLALLSHPSQEGQSTQTEAPAGAAGSGKSGLLDTMLVPMMMCVVVFWLIVIRPEKKNRKVREEMLGALKKGDPVVTSGGIHGTVVTVKDEVVTILVADGVRLRFSIQAVQNLVEKEGAEKESA
jgi:preprotein translocase subunit YajC